MKRYSFMKDLIFSLHQRGFNDDFKSTGCNLLWVQQKKPLRENEFDILEWHHLYKDGGKEKDTLILGLSVTCLGPKGILIVDLKKNHSKRPHILIKKLNESIVDSAYRSGFAIS